ncbi:MAG: D-alanine--D-alanine ligase [Pseudomonadaceae bacterium]|nr:D-alanine--D-alanine ligase [Pseudomonadaceae bacterium]
MAFEDIQKVIVLAGGRSAEAEVSRSSAKGVAGALAQLGVVHEVWELEGDWVVRLAAEVKEGLFVFVGLHGCPGEDGVVQGVLDVLGIPYQGSGLLGCALAMDKVRARVAMAAAGVEVAEAVWGDGATDDAVAALLAKHGKVVVKPSTAGSSVGISVLDGMAGWPVARDAAAAHGDVLVEAFVAGKELTAGVLGDEALAVVEIIPRGAFYDIESKYAVGGSVHECPAKLPEVVTARVQQGALKAARAVDARGACRVDFRYDGTQDRLVALEVNTLPGMTPTSLLPDAARYAGMDYAALVRWMIDDGLTRKAG